MARSYIDRFIYSITKKPKHYVKVKNPPRTIAEKLARPQAARQMQYNRWCKRYKIYSGSYFPKNSQRLLRKGWIIQKRLQNGALIMRRKSSGQTIRSESHGVPHHYHWLDFWEKPFINARFRKFKSRDFSGEKVYYNEYGELTNKFDPAHHISGDEKDN